VSVHDIVVIGGSQGSLLPIRTLLGSLAQPFAASVFVVQHRSSSARGVNLKDLLANGSALRVVEVWQPLEPEPGTVYIPPLDRHLLLEPGRVYSMHGPRENLARPSIDVLFRSAAVAFGSRVIGVILSGTMVDGAQGLLAVRRCGGVCVVQDPEDANADELPLAAIRTAAPEHSVRTADLAGLLRRLVATPPGAAREVPRDLALEAKSSASAMLEPRELGEIGELTSFTCPECQGPLWHLHHEGMTRYRCHVGHAFTPEALLNGQSQELERALWVAYRALRDRGEILKRMVDDSRNRASGSARSYQERLQEVESHSRAVLNALGSLEGLEAASAALEGE
jgi:two-component system chemotaxis response regulator CheB